MMMILPVSFLFGTSWKKMLTITATKYYYHHHHHHHHITNDRLSLSLSVFISLVYVLNDKLLLPSLYFFLYVFVCDVCVYGFRDSNAYTHHTHTRALMMMMMMMMVNNITLTLILDTQTLSRFR